MPLDSAPGRVDADVILVGGGLANGLIAWRLGQLRPELHVLLLESGQTLGGNHTWSFHDSDLSAQQRSWLAPLIVHTWPHYSVNFPRRRRTLESGYASITSERFDAILQRDLRERVCTDVHVQTVTPRGVTLTNGHALGARVVIDGRGVRASSHLTLGYQKFLGQELKLSAPHGLTGPILMDARVPQHDGYRFVYTLPLSVDTVLVEDTFYADGSHVDAERLRTNITTYAYSQGWQIESVLREENGVLPITLAGDVEAFWRDAQGVPRAGLAAGLFNSATGYSLPDAVQLAERLGALPPAQWTSEFVFETIRTHAAERWKEQGFFRLLNRMLFRAAAPAERWRVIERFYGLPLPLIQRFYAARLRPWDKVRILSGKPPVALGPALRAALKMPPTLAQKEVP
jgi:lycopene beta-cyclase